MCFRRKKEVTKQERLPPLEERISYVANGLYGPLTDEKGKFISGKDYPDKGGHGEKDKKI